MHRLALQIGLEPAERRGPGLGVLAHPAVVDEPDRNRIQEVELLAAPAPRRDQPRLLEHPQVLHDGETRHRQPALERAQRLSVALEERVEQTASRGVREGLEHGVHCPREYVTIWSHVNREMT